MRDRESIERLRNSIGRTEQFLADTPPPRPYTRADALIDRLRAFGTGRGGSKHAEYLIPWVVVVKCLRKMRYYVVNK